MLGIECYHKYPDLVMDVVDYFEIGPSQNSKSIQDFCLKIAEKYPNKPHLPDEIQPRYVLDICTSLCRAGVMTQICSSGIFNMQNNYVFVPLADNERERQRSSLKNQFNAIVYGFEYIYYRYSSLVVPIVNYRSDRQSVGTGFVVSGGIATAKHCLLEDANKIAIEGFSGNQLNASRVLESDDPRVDIAFIPEVAKKDDGIRIDNGRVLEEVLVMGYPRIPCFLSFLTGEKATISSIAKRDTVTRGSIVAFGHQYISNMDLMLITAKIRGGNSGSPIINKQGNVVGIACQIPEYKGDYDDVGYGVAVPSSELLKVMGCGHELHLPANYFVDFQE